MQKDGGEDVYWIPAARIYVEHSDLGKLWKWDRHNLSHLYIRYLSKKLSQHHAASLIMKTMFSVLWLLIFSSSCLQLCVSYFSTAVIEYSDRKQVKDKGWAYSSRVIQSTMMGKVQEQEHEWSHIICIQEEEREREQEVEAGHKTSKPALQWYTSSLIFHFLKIQ